MEIELRNTRATKPPPPTAERVRELLDYDPETGVFVWRVDRGPNKAGDVAGTLRSDGRRNIGIDGRYNRANRLAWIHFYGKQPENVIDHIDGNPENNAIANLRDVTVSVNGQNQKRANAGNKWPLGTSLHYGKWEAKICLDGRRIYLGRYPSPELAHAAYVSAKRQLHEGNTL